MQRVSVTCAIIWIDSKILVTQRSAVMAQPMKWEFPGGKIEDGEEAMDCIVREIKEEINIEIEIVERWKSNVHNYENFEIELIPFLSKYKAGEIVLREHKEYRLVEVRELSAFDWAPADLPVVAAIIDRSLSVGIYKT